ncbi:MAG: tripartite tricarboxylate transporter permease [Thermoflexus sp.]|jgi:putative membrane protein|nr:tripartite tricarboxylate transporter permease [Thermoflexus sp.]
MSAELLLGVGVGLMLSGISAIIPGLHPYNLVAALLFSLPEWGRSLPADGGLGLGIGVAAGYAFFHLAPAVFYQTPDEGTMGLLLPAQKALREGWGQEAVRWAGWGAWGAVMLLLLSAPFWPRGWAALRAVLAPHVGWILLALSAFLLLSEWPWGAERLPTPGRRLIAIWTRLGAGVITFLLSGALGFLLLARNPLTGPLAGQPLIPAFLGLFAVPGLLQAMTGSRPVPPRPSGEELPLGIWARGVGAGLLGGVFVVLFPGVTAGIGGLLAGHATAQRDDRAFLVAQGAARAFCSIGVFWLLLLPDAPAARGGLGIMLAPWAGPATPDRYRAAVLATAGAAALAFLMMEPLAWGMSRWVASRAWRGVYAAALVLILLSVAWLGGIPGLTVLLAASGIGLLPSLTGSRRLNTLGVILVPLTLRRLGLEGVVWPILGL